MTDSPEIPLTCGFCYPDLDFDTYVHQPCNAHKPMLDGADDAAAKARFGTEWISGTGEAGGHGNAEICEAIHQRSRVVKGG